MNETVDRLNQLYENSQISFNGLDKVKLAPDDILLILQADNAARWLLKNRVLENLPKMADGRALPIVKGCWYIIEGKLFDNSSPYRMIAQFAMFHGWKGYDD